MQYKGQKTPLYDRLIEHTKRDPLSFHVPGHKFGEVFPSKGKRTFKDILSIDATEITGMDDLHAAEEVIDEAQKLAADFFGADETYFLVNGSTSGNLAAILATCRSGDQVLVQRNCHKSIMHGIELAGAHPVFFTPEYEHETNRYTCIHEGMIKEALHHTPRVAAVILTYPDYFGRTYPIEEVITAIHEYNIPVIVDEAHGVHFSLGPPFPKSSLHAGADIVVQSAHKMAPAMTMSSFLHTLGSRVNKSRLTYYLQVFQSSSPSYPLMASLDLSRLFLETFKEREKEKLLSYLSEIREAFSAVDAPFCVLPVTERDDLLKLTLETKEGWTGFEVAEVLESVGIYPELATTEQVLLVCGLAPSFDLGLLKKRLGKMNWQLKIGKGHDTIKKEQLLFPKVQSLDLSYQDMQQATPEFVSWSAAAGRICAEAVVPYPPGIPFILKGERMTEQQVRSVRALLEQNTRFQNTYIEQGTWVF
ncbi:lysine decarboxylase [Halobacillus andaensis]|uniref:Lysine decarboxylase n=1 Tax=Halobacillus andaensis TaxID=1176239 RepID=A0A917BBT7_HALAA|nr:aminotransferase class I/II-fold pyridoxal phosphate-dependent enzyme [Halobacillus andaensis]MBP2006699.1 lysine decarboxylase [Halobacillus andaensis]GGF35958.1 lysine decarboxylase [Halobacillus andaensis]